MAQLRIIVNFDISFIVQQTIQLNQNAMKTTTITLMTFLLFVGTSCQVKMDKTKEEEAIKAAIEGEKVAFFNQDKTGICNFWVQDDKSKKIWLSENGAEMIEGWDKIKASIEKEVTDTSWNRKQMTCTFSDYQIDIMDNSAWVTNKSNWKGIFKGKDMDFNQSRIEVLKKVDGKWKFALMAIYDFPMNKDTIK